MSLALALPRVRVRRRRWRLRPPDPGDFMVMAQIVACVVIGWWALGMRAPAAGCVAFTMAGLFVRILVRGWGRQWTRAEMRAYERTVWLSAVVGLLLLLRV